MSKKIIKPAVNAEAAPETLEAAIGQIADLKQQLADTMQANAALQSAIEDMESKLDSASKGKVVGAIKSKPDVPTKSFKVEGVDYVFTHAKFHYDGKTITATEALTDSKLLAKLVEIGYGGIKRKGE